jgi:hypothetical protein
VTRSGETLDKSANARSVDCRVLCADQRCELSPIG